MTIQEYFAIEQPIDTTIIEEPFYHVFREIVFRKDKDHYAIIKVAHIGEDLWAFGWEIKDGLTNPILGRDCTSNITTKGKIDQLLFGMTKVLLRHMKESYRPSQLMTNLIYQAGEEAVHYLTSEKSYNKKITI